MQEKNFELKLSSYASTYNSPYIAKVVRINEINKLEGSNNLLTCQICGYPVIFNKNISLGDIVIFVPCGCAINKDFLSKNNLFNLYFYYLNSNSNIIDNIIADKNFDNVEKCKNIKKLCGFFDKTRKVNAITFLNMPSQGFVINFSKSMQNWLGDMNLNPLLYEGICFDSS